VNMTWHPDAITPYLYHTDGTRCGHGLDPAQLGTPGIVTSVDLARVWAPAARARCGARRPLAALQLPTYQHAEAFAVMYYQADDITAGGELVWNSRDGVTPFVIGLRSGGQATHAWNIIVPKRMPEDWQPPPGMRVFTDLTPARARALHAANVDKWLAQPNSRAALLETFPGGRAAAIADLTATTMDGPPGQPDLIDPGPDTAWTRAPGGG
jgi:hypothetical protein